jgi:hypothetical protein
MSNAQSRNRAEHARARLLVLVDERAAGHVTGLGGESFR